MRVVALLPSDVPFGHDWADATATVADVVRVQPVGALTAPAVDPAGRLAPDPHRPACYQFAVPRALPWRIFGRHADLTTVRPTVQALEWIADRHGRIDVLHTHFYGNARNLPAVARALGVPFVVTEHNSSLLGTSPDKVIGTAGLGIAGRAYAAAAAVLPVSHSLLDAIVGRGLRGRFVVLPNPVDVELFHPAAVAPPAPPFRVACVARLARVKALDGLLEAVARLRSGGCEVEVDLVGTGPLDDELRSLAARLDLGAAVRFRGRLARAEVAEVLRASHLLVLPSIAENLPVAVIEARCSGLPVVATAVGGLGELVDDRSGILVAPRDVDALAGAVARLLASPPAGLAAATEQARETFCHAAVGAAFGRVLEAVVAGRVPEGATVVD